MIVTAEQRRTARWAETEEIREERSVKMQLMLSWTEEKRATSRRTVKSWWPLMVYIEMIIKSTYQSYNNTRKSSFLTLVSSRESPVHLNSLFLRVVGGSGRSKDGASGSAGQIELNHVGSCSETEQAVSIIAIEAVLLLK